MATRSADAHASSRHGIFTSPDVGGSNGRRVRKYGHARKVGAAAGACLIGAAASLIFLSDIAHAKSLEDNDDGGSSLSEESLVNWSGTHKVTTARYFAPSSIEEVCVFVWLSVCVGPGSSSLSLSISKT